ncbi:ABC transporter ATP-binding protein [Paenibacillus polymyxa]|uniref:ABC transporter ATP-binding protein n=1 Tax=Paenibacillus polymyxa TaxID=1406 RepID=UPI000C9EF592|nr:ABC transporter ATP-binding protein [Paenibacillus polymyxa]PNQ85050.1 ABC transporter ATP-binding protein [Paenibacillus polymyxa]
MNNEISIRVRELTKVYRLYEDPKDRVKDALKIFKKSYFSEFYALKDISFTIFKGETIGIIGKNGSGKSTLLKILAGVLNPTSGYFEVNGKVAALLELGAGFNMEYTGLENIYLNGTLIGRTKIQTDEILADILEFADIGDFIHQPVKSYSSGMFARLAFAVAIHQSPDILIVDEALAVGDLRFQTKCYRKFEEMKKWGTTILFVGHDVSSIRRFCDRTLWIHNGQIIDFGDTGQITAKYMELMLSDESVNENVLDSKQKQSLTEELNESINKQPMISDLDKRTINRWGKHKGSIVDVTILNQSGEKVEILNYEEKYFISIIFDLNVEMHMEYLSIAVSIKNKVGMDIIVFTTYETNLEFYKNDSRAEVKFEFINYLTEGDYNLAVAVENRENVSPEYYDYIEGAYYFKCFSEKQLFGIIRPPMNNHLIYFEE